MPSNLTPSTSALTVSEIIVSRSMAGSESGPLPTRPGHMALWSLGNPDFFAHVSSQTHPKFRLAKPIFPLLSRTIILVSQSCRSNCQTYVWTAACRCASRFIRLSEPLILTGTIKPGQTIDEKDIAARLSVSRTPVREAVKKLSDEHLVEVIAQSATRAARIDRDERSSNPILIRPRLGGGERIAGCDAHDPSARRPAG